MLRVSFVRTRLGRSVRRQIRCFSNQLTKAEGNEVVVSSENYEEIRKKYRWDRWVNDFPSILKKQSEQRRDQWTSKEGQYHAPTSASSINFNEWRRRIKSPGVVDLIEAEYNSHDMSNYGPTHFDDLTHTSKEALFEAGDAEADDIGHETIINGVARTGEERRKAQLEFAESRVEDAKNWLDELYQDREQHQARMDGLLVRTELMEMAEFPELARYCEELAYGEPNSSRATPIFNYYYEEIFVDRRAEHAAAITDATMSRRQEEFEAFKEAYEELGFHVDLEALKESILVEQNEWNRNIEEKFYELDGEGEYYDPNTGRYHYEESGALVPNP